MKNSLLILFLLYSLCATGQNYQCLQPGMKHYFINANGYLRGIRIDSVRTYPDSTIYYPFHTPRGPYPALTGSTTLVPLDSTGGSWLGKKVIHKSDGTFLFDNIWQDTVFIRTQAHVGDSWVFYNDTSARSYIATITDQDTMTVLGILDSVKKISVNAYNGSVPFPADSINTYGLVISKNHGFVTAFDFYTFPYHAPGIGFNLGYDYYLDVMWNYAFGIYPFSAKNMLFFLIPLVNPTWTQLYDRTPGDQFEYYAFAHGDYHLPPTNTYWLDSVNTRASSPDSLRYNYRGWLAMQTQTAPAYVPGYPYPYTFYSINNDRSFYNIPVIDTFRMPEECGNTQFIYYFPNDTTYAINSCAYRFSRNDLSGNSYNSNIHFESSGPDRTVKIGLGQTHFQRYDAGSDWLSDSSLVYYKRGSTSYGTYILPVSVAVTDPAKTVNSTFVYPNPATTSLTITSSTKITSITITNLLGQTIYTNDHNSDKVEIDVNHLTPGIYLIKINGSEIRKFIKN